MSKLKRQNLLGIIALFMGGIAFAFGPDFGLLPAISIVFCIFTYGTFDKSIEDNPWPFYIGFILSLIGLYMVLRGLHHDLNIQPTNLFEDIGFGGIIAYEVKDKELIAKIPAQVSPAGFSGEIVIVYEFRDKMFQAESIEWQRYE
ncbi:MAG TPA: hypothetical protein GX497_07570 [Bacillus bacterium]|nr:hypothetical protein [Bacillus sp. (in: firmicutes)]